MHKRVGVQRWRSLARAITWLVVVGAWAFAGPQADAAGPKYGKRTAKVRTRGSIKTTVDRETKKASRQRQERPQLTAAQLASQRTATAMNVVEDQIKTLRKLIKLTAKNDPDFPDLLFRLADLHLSVKAYHELQAGALDERIYELREAGKADQARLKKAKQKRHRAAAKNQAQLAIAPYAKLARDPAFSTYKRLDEALYYYAFELGQLGRDAQMQEAFVRLIREFPTSRYTPNAYLSFGDLKFAAGDVADALRLYQKVVDAYPGSDVYAYALYKIGWCHLNPIGTAEPDYAKSLGAFVAAIDATNAGKAGSKQNARLLRRDARRDMVRAYVHAGKPSRAWSFFDKHGRGPTKSETMVREMMERLATAYFGEGMYVESSAAYRELQRRFAKDPDICHWQHRIVINALATDDPEIQWIEAQRLAESWGDRRESWTRAQTKRCRDAAQDTLARLATVWHDEADKTGRDETYARAAAAYEAYGQHFGATKDAYELAYYHAEALWQRAGRLVDSKKESDRERGRELFRSSAEQFDRVLAMKPKGKFAKDSAYAQMLAWKNHLDYDETATARRGCELQTNGTCARSEAASKYEPISISDDEQAMLAAYDRYATFIEDRDDPELPKILYHRARVYVEHNRFDDAKPHLEELVTKFDGTVYAVWAAEMLLDVLTIDWADQGNTPDDRFEKGKRLEKFARRLLKAKLIRHTEAARLQKSVPRLIAVVGWVEADIEHQRGKAGDEEGYVRCGRKYRGIYLEFSEHDRADELLFNAARCLEAGYLLGQAIAVREELLEQFPDSDKAAQTLREVGENYQRIAFYDKAATRFETYAQRHPKDDYSAQALHNAYLFRMGLGDESRAADDLERYEKMFRRKDPKRAATIFWARHELIDDPAERLEHATDYISTYGAKGGKDRLVVAHAAAGAELWRKSCPRALLHDSCVTIRRTKAGAGQRTRVRAGALREQLEAKVPKRCGSDTQAVITVHRRDPALARKAQGHFERAASLAAKTKVPDDPDRETEFRMAWGMAEVFAADEIYEEYLAINMPGDLDFGLEHMWKKETGVPRYEREYAAAVKRREASMKRFKAFFDRKDELAAELAKRYAAVRHTESPHWILAAAARAAMVNQNFADQLYRAEVPRGLKSWEQYAAYCDQVGDFAQVPQQRARKALDYCLQRSTEFQYFNDYSRMCEEELQQRDPDAYPATNELFGTSVYTDSQLDHVGVQTKLTSDQGNGGSSTRRIAR